MQIKLAIALSLVGIATAYATTGTIIQFSTVDITTTDVEVTSESQNAVSPVNIQTSTLTDSSSAVTTADVIVSFSSRTATQIPATQSYQITSAENAVHIQTSSLSVTYASQTATYAQSVPEISRITGNAIQAEPQDLIIHESVESSTRTASVVPLVTAADEIITKTSIEPTISMVGADKSIIHGKRIVIVDEEITLEPGDEREEIVVAGTNPGLTKIVINELTKDPKINLNSLLEAGDGVRTVTYPAPLSMIVVSSSTRVEVEMPPDVTMSSTLQWDGVMDLPRTVPASSIDIRSGTVTYAMQVGLDENSITFDSPVRMVFYGKASQSAGFEVGGERRYIETVCVADNREEARIQLDGSGECRMDAGPDLIVWTFHFTRFYTAIVPDAPDAPEPAVPDAQIQEAPAPAEPERTAAGPGQAAPSVSRGGGGGGGGGGGLAGTDARAPVGAQPHIRQISWNCNAGMVEVLAGPDIEDLHVSVRTAKLGQNPAERSGTLDGYARFAGPMAADDRYVMVQATYLAGRDVSADSKSLDLDSCTGSAVFEAPLRAEPAQAVLQEEIPAQPAPAAPAEARVVEPEPAARIEPPPAPPAPELPDAEPPEILSEPVAPRPESPEAEAAGQGGGCLVATAAYGTELSGRVQMLREVRDRTVMSTDAGAAFMSAFNAAYYAVSPSVADMQRQSPILNAAAGALLAPALWSAGIMAHAEPGSDASVVLYGLAAALLVSGAYAGAPSCALYACRRIRARARY